MRPSLGALLFALLLAAAPCAGAGEYAVVSSNDVDATSLSSAELRALVQMDRHFWKPGHPVVVILPSPGSPARGFVVLIWGEGGWVQFFSKEPLWTPEDYKRAKIFTWSGDKLQATSIPGAGHFVFIDPQSDVWPQVLSTVQRLLSVGK